MNQIVDTATIVSAVPIPMTRREKLMAWARLIRSAPGSLYLFHGLEHWRPYDLAVPFQYYFSRAGMPVPLSAFSIAAADATFREQGFKGESPAEVMQFFELTQAQLHEFSCDCGGHISNEEQARRIERLA